MKPLAEPALKAVLDGTIKIIPERFVGVYRYWMENIKDWCISRQLWWGHQIPAYYLPDGTVVVGETKEIAYEEAKKQGFQGSIEDLQQDPDVLDTWFSSWLWPLSVFNGILEPNNKDFQYYYPTNVLITAPEILFFWVARMIMAGYAFAQKPPFYIVYLHGIVRDKYRRKMSKSLGNSPDPLELMDKYGADGVRMGMLLAAPAGNDLLFDEALCEQGKNFCNKIWNALRLVKMIEEKQQPREPSSLENLAMQWMQQQLVAAAQQLTQLLETFRFSEGIKHLYKLIWDDFCSWYLELIKPRPDISKVTYEATCTIFEQLMQLLHPFMPFITEEVWQRLRKREEGASIMVSALPKWEEQSYDATLLQTMDAIRAIVTQLRNFAQQYQIPKTLKTNLITTKAHAPIFQEYLPILQRFTFVDGIEVVEDFPQSCLVYVVQGIQYGLDAAKLPVDFRKELQKIEKQISKTKRLLERSLGKLQNEQFLQKAAVEVVERERQKAQQLKNQLETLQKQKAELEAIL